ncbi:MAG: hypothetical protein ABSG13_09490 [Bryobacteraceae bacterium]|jgi:hypothetical protein
MRRILPVVIGCVLLVLPGFAQRGGHGGGGGMRGGGGGMRGGSGFSGGGMRGGGTFRGGGGFRGGGFRGIGGFRGRTGFRGFYGYPYYYPGLYGGFYDPYFWDYGDYGDSGYAYPDYGSTDYGGYTTYGAPNPQVLIISNQAPPQPVIVQPPPAPAVWNSGPSTQAKKYEDPLFLLAMKDGTIRAVLAYWVEGATVHYVTMDHEQKQTPLSSLDHGLSERLNRERNVTFSLPG